jgi:hypothetical protein
MFTLNWLKKDFLKFWSFPALNVSTEGLLALPYQGRDMVLCSDSF